MATERVVIQFREDGSRVVKRNIKGIAQESKKASASSKLLAKSLLAVGSALTIRGVIDLSREVQQIDRRIRAVSENSEQFARNLGLVREVSQRTRTAVGSNAAAFQKLVIATRGVGASSQDTSRILETLNKSFAIGGASAQEAQSALLQLSQGLSSGALQGDELRSLRENAAFLSDILADELGVDGVGGLKKLGAEGKLTSKVLTGALLSAGDRIDSQFNKLPKTLDESLTELKNSLSGFGQEISPIIDGITKVIGRIGQGIELAISSLKLLQAENKLEDARQNQRERGSSGIARGLIPDEIDARTGRAVGFTRTPEELLPEANQALIKAVKDRIEARNKGDLEGLAITNRRVESAKAFIKTLKEAQDSRSDAVRLAEQELALAKARNDAAIAGRVFNPAAARDSVVGRPEQDVLSKKAIQERDRQETARRQSAQDFFGGGFQDAISSFSSSSAAANALSQEEVDILRTKQSILTDLREEENARIVNQQSLNELLASGSITQAQYNDLIKELGVETEKAITAGDGIVAAFERIDTSAAAVGQQIGTSMVSAIGQASNALAGFVVDGLQNFDDLRTAVADILKNLAQQILATIIQATILRAITSSIGGGGGGGIGATIGAISGREGGGPVTAGEPVIVGEKRPEVFVPQRSGNILPRVPEGQGSEAPPIQIINITDPDEVGKALEDPGNERKIVNVIRRNRRQLGIN